MTSNKYIRKLEYAYLIITILINILDQKSGSVIATLLHGIWLKNRKT